MTVTRHRKQLAAKISGARIGKLKVQERTQWGEVAGAGVGQGQKILASFRTNCQQLHS